jgi:hypothetical protein
MNNELSWNQLEFYILHFALLSRFRDTGYPGKLRLICNITTLRPYSFFPKPIYMALILRKRDIIGILQNQNSSARLSSVQARSQTTPVGTSASASQFKWFEPLLIIQ